MDKERFSLLLLEPNEIYFEDFLSNLIAESPKNSNDDIRVPEENQCIGHLKMCSKSLVFDPKDFDMPLIKIAYKNCSRIFIWPGRINGKESNVLAITCDQYTEMLAKNIVAPYTFKMETRTFLFNFQYAKVYEYLEQMRQLQRASKLHACDQNDMIAAIVYSRHKRVKFNPLWLEDIYETVLVDYTVDEIHPLILNPGRLLLTTKRIYFQPYNNIQPYPVIKINLESVTNLIRRRYVLQHIGCEIKWCENDSERLLYVSFRNQSECDEFYEQTMQQNCVKITQTEPESMTLKWQNGIISNYDYLLYLNSLADRTCHDLTQYPVFPWVLSDYVSESIDLDDPKYYRDLTKPIGALNEERLKQLLERYDEMDEPRHVYTAQFLYGSHYSAPALVLFFLVRARQRPKLMLCLQNGYFDHPDRMFNKVSDTFRNCLRNMADFKELIPEFYDTTETGNFLVNSMKINFGKRSDGTPVDDVILPPWADNSPEKFISILRDALESEYVSQHLHHWIDLIFGYKQRGEEAIKAHNLFFHLCYEGAVDLDHVNDLTKRHALEVQISEFGQVPKQLFTKPHVPRLCSNPLRRLSSVDREHVPDVVDTNEQLLGSSFKTITFLDNYQSHKDLISSVLVDGSVVVSTGKDGLLKCYNTKEKRQIRSISIGNMTVSSCIKIPNQNIFILGSWDNSITIYDCDYGRKVNEVPAHDDAVSCMSYIDEIGVLVSASWDCTVKIWKGFNTKPYSLSDSLISYYSFDEKVFAIDAFHAKDCIKVVIGLENGEVIVWRLKITGPLSMNTIETIDVKHLFKHDDEVTDVSFNKSGTKVATCALDSVLYVCDIDTGMTLFKKEHSNCLICLSWCHESGILYLGDNKGLIYVWNMMTGEQNCSISGFSGPITSITSDLDTTNEAKCKVIAAGVDGSDFLVKAWINE